MRAIIVSALCLALGASVLSASEREEPRVKTAHVALRRSKPVGLRWTHSQRLDVNCDGAPDEVFTATDQSRFYVAVVLAPITPRSRYSIVSFALSGESQDSLCDRFESLTPEALPDVTEALGDLPEGYRISTSCQGLRLAAGECDPFHLYWNHGKNALYWWRL